ncbi:MAG: S9 family peptidase [Hyphomicrobiaceae bacterium]|nr:S9 family peptidase [Hyphomicrobiaceae bacterium]
MSKSVPPHAEKRQHNSTHHGIDRQDPYHWLKADNWQEVMHNPVVLAADIRDYLEAENAYFETEFEKPNEALSEAIYKEIRGRIKEDDSGVPSPDGPFAYNSKMAEGKQYPILVRTPRQGGEETVLLDCNAEAEGVDYFGFGGAAHDETHRYLAWSADRKGSEFYSIHVRDLETGKDQPDLIEKTAGGVVWTRDSKAFLYVEQDQNHRPYRVRKHVMGTEQSDDPVIYTEKDSGFFVAVGATHSRQYLLIEAHDHQTSEVYLLDANAETEPHLVEPRKENREYGVEEADGLLYIHTNDGDAEDFKIVTAPANEPGAANWTDLVPHQGGVLILSAFVIKGRLIRLERADGLPRIIIRDLSSGEEKPIAFEEEAYALGVSAGYEFDTDTIRFTYSSPTTPSRVYDYNVKTGDRTLRKEQEVPSGHNPDDYVTRRIHAKAPDGEEIPVTLLHRATTRLDGSAPCLLYGYGSYGMSMPAGFSISTLSLVDRGFVYAIAHIRGGEEKGRHWYREGRGMKKRNTFTDFIAVADYLAEAGLVDGKRIIAQGGSAGGMLMGAVTNMRPDRFEGIIAQVPFVDVLNTMLDDTLPLTPPEWPEWGNPITSKEAYDYIASYSPYDNIETKDYPAIFALAGLTDPRVTYWEPAKWVARLRDHKTDINPLYLRTNMGAGHGGASGRFDRLKEVALTYAFAIMTAGAPETI